MILNHAWKLNYVLHFFICQVYPSQCCLCYADCLTANLLCSNCWFKVNFLTAPTCKKCGSTIESLYNDDLCQGDSCFYKSHHYNSIISIIAYNDIGKELIGKFKFQKKFILMKLWKCWFTYINQQLNALQADLIIPVPMHKEKLKIRGFNQTSFLARILAKVSKIDYGRNILYKIKDTPNQRDLSQLERANNLLDAFSIEPNKAKMLIGKNILLIDDIVTTGATVNECAKVLLQSGASKVNVLTIARRQLRY